jgi:hypothetical protein
MRNGVTSKTTGTSDHYNGRLVHGKKKDIFTIIGCKWKKKNNMKQEEEKQEQKKYDRPTRAS